MRWFLFIFLQESRIRDYLNALIFLANPTEKLPAHITVGGPYNNRRRGRSPKLEKYQGRRVAFIGAGNFFHDGQNTVFLRCGSDFLDEVWDKGAEYNTPHLTIYDGDSRSFAERLFNNIESFKMFFTARVGKVCLMQSLKGQKNFGLLMETNFELVRNSTQLDFTKDEIVAMDDSQRLAHICRVLTNLKQEINRHSQAEQD